MCLAGMYSSSRIREERYPNMLQGEAIAVRLDRDGRLVQLQTKTNLPRKLSLKTMKGASREVNNRTSIEAWKGGSLPR